MKLTSVRMTGILFYSQVQRSMAGFKRFLEFQIYRLMIFLPAVVATLYPFVPDTAYQFVGQDLMFLFGYVDNNYRLRFSADSFSTPHDGQFFHQSQITMSLWPPRCRKVNRVRKGRDLHSHVMPAEYKRRQSYSLQFDPLGRSCVGLHNTRLGLKSFEGNNKHTVFLYSVSSSSQFSSMLFRIVLFILLYTSPPFPFRPLYIEEWKKDGQWQGLRQRPNAVCMAPKCSNIFGVIAVSNGLRPKFQARMQLCSSVAFLTLTEALIDRQTQMPHTISKLNT